MQDTPVLPQGEGIGGENYLQTRPSTISHSISFHVQTILILVLIAYRNEFLDIFFQSGNCWDFFGWKGAHHASALWNAWEGVCTQWQGSLAWIGVFREVVCVIDCSCSVPFLLHGDSRTVGLLLYSLQEVPTPINQEYRIDKRGFYPWPDDYMELGRQPGHKVTEIIPSKTHSNGARNRRGNSEP